jgi:hypothetical protein
MENLLEQKIALENLWTKMYRHHGVYTNQMVYLDKALSNIRKKIIVQDQEAMKKRVHNQIND